MPNPAPSARHRGNRAGRVPLERALSKLGIASRTQARQWILDGRVRVDGKIIRTPNQPVIPEIIKIEIDGTVTDKAPMKTFLLYKPRGVVTTRADERGRSTVFSLIRAFAGHLGSVGRLDFATSGLLLLTNDTRLADWLCDPSNQVPRVYLVTVRGKIKDTTLTRLKDGIEDNGDRLAADRVSLRKQSQKESHLVVELHEGKNREIRRMFATLGHEVTKLKRVSYGGLSLGSLRPGEYRELSANELRVAFPGAPVR